MGIIQYLFSCWNKDANYLLCIKNLEDKIKEQITIIEERDIDIKEIENKIKEQMTIIEERDIDIKELESILKDQSEYLNVSTTVK